MPLRWLDLLACGIVTSMTWPAAWGATTVFGDAAVTRFPGGEDAYSGSLSWQQATPGSGVLVGLSDTHFPVGSLAVASVDGYHAMSERLFLTLGASLGDANSGGTQDSTLYKLRFAVDAKVDTQWSVRLADQFIDLDVVHGHLVTAGAEYRPTPRWELDLTGGYGVSGTLRDRYGQLAVNWFGTPRLYGGVVLGRTGYDLANLGEDLTVKNVIQAYAGAAIPVGRGTFTIGVDVLSLSGAARETLRFGFIEPINL